MLCTLTYNEISSDDQLYQFIDYNIISETVSIISK
jgi:hypothetical protein